MERSEQRFSTSRALRYLILAIFGGGVALFFIFGRGFVGAPITIVLWTSGEKMNYLKDIVLQFTQEKHTTSELFSDGNKQPIHVEA
jgi:hypothetical protein